MKNHLLTICLLWSMIGISQDFTPLQSSGKIPTDFTTATLDKIHAHELEGDEDFNAQVYYGIDRILHSGEVCFNDPLSNYANKVLNVIKESNPDVPNDVRIYTVKSAVVNAFSTQQGIIFINAGLFAKIENEAQLAFILCHELVHYQEKHVMQSYEQTEELKANNEDYKTVKDVADQVTSARFSRSMEKEADKKGLEMYLNTPYDPNAVNGVFDVLLYSYLPFKEVKFDSTFLSFGDQPIPETYFTNELDSISAEEDIDDWRLTHPNIAKRKKLIKHIIGDSIVAGKKFILPASEFEQIHALAQFEVLDINTKSGSYTDALYAGFLLLNDYPNSYEVKNNIGHVLFGAALMANTKDRNDVINDYKRDEGEIQQAAYFLSKIKSKDLSVLAARYNMELLKQHPSDSTAYRRASILFGDLNYYYNIDSTTLGIGNSESIKTKWPYSMLNKLDSSLIGPLTHNGYILSEQIKINKANTGDEERDEELKEEQLKQSQENLKKGFALGANKVVFLEPQTASYIYQKKVETPFQTVQTEELRQNMYRQIKLAGQMENVEVAYMGGNIMDTNQTDTYNDFVYINTLLTEQLAFEGRANTVGLSDSTQALIDKYGTKYFALTGLANSKKHTTTGAKVGVILISIPLWFLSPYLIPRAFIPRKKMESFCLVFNLETGEMAMYSFDSKKGKTTESKINKQYQYYFEQIAAEPRN